MGGEEEEEKGVNNLDLASMVEDRGDKEKLSEMPSARKLECPGLAQKFRADAKISRAVRESFVAVGCMMWAA